MLEASKLAGVSHAERVQGVFELTRVGNAIAAGVLTFIGAFVAEGTGILETSIAVSIAIAITILATAAGMAINDYFDRDIDLINKPERPIPRGAVTPKYALVFSLILFCLAGILALVLPPLGTAIAIVNLIALVTYTKFFKGMPGVGNLLVSYLGGSAFLFGAAAVGQINISVVTLFLLAASSTFARELIKDIEDIEGDREEGLKTLPIVIGRQFSLLLALLVLILAVLASPIPYLIGTFGVAYLLLVTPAVLVALYAGYRSLSDPSAGQSILKYGMYLSAVAFIGGRVTLLL